MTTTVVVPVKNEERIILNFLHTLLQQTQHPTAVIVVDNGSTDHTVDLIQHCVSEYQSQKVELTILFCPTGNQIEARQLGFSSATTDLIITVDADTRLHPQWIANAKKLFHDRPDIVGAGGWNIYDRFFVTVPHSIVFIFGLLFPTRYFFYGSNGVFRADAYRRSSKLHGCRTYIDEHEFHAPYDDVWLSFDLKTQGKVHANGQLRTFCQSRMRYPGNVSAHGLQRMYWQVKETLTVQRLFMKKN